MGLLDSVSRALGSSNEGPTGGSALQALLPAVLEMLQGSRGGPGGLEGLVRAFEKNGLGDIAKSWVSTGQNLPVSPAQLDAVLGKDTLQGLAGRAGLPADGIGGLLSGLLPDVVDKLTPDGRIPQEGASAPGIGDLLGSLLGPR